MANMPTVHPAVPEADRPQGAFDLAVAAAFAGRDLMVSVLPPLDTQPPSVAITAPDGAASLFGQVTVTADASDDIAVSSVIFRIGPTDIGHDSLPPYEMPLNTAAFPDANHSRQVRTVYSEPKEGTIQKSQH